VSLALGVAVYVICWWVVLFAILPFGVETQEEAGHVEPGTPESAPVAHRLVPKLIATTLVSGVLFTGIYAVMEYKLLTLDDIPFLPRYTEQ
jgi:predicted secreted protein